MTRFSLNHHRKPSAVWSWRRVISLTVLQLLALALFAGLILLLTGCSSQHIIEQADTMKIICDRTVHIQIAKGRVVQTSKCTCPKP